MAYHFRNKLWGIPQPTELPAQIFAYRFCEKYSKNKPPYSSLSDLQKSLLLNSIISEHPPKENKHLQNLGPLGSIYEKLYL